MPPIPIFETQHITLRPFTKDDAPALLVYLNHPELTGRRYTHWDFDDDLPLTLPEAEKIIEKWQENSEGFCYAVIKKDDDMLIGHVSTDWGWDPHMPDCAVVISPPFQRQGFGTQALSLLLDYLFDFTVAHNVSNGIVEWNAPAIAFAGKLGFTRVGKLRRDTYRAGKFYDNILYDILRPEWKERSHAA